jgi:hypothetical protein
MKEQIKELAEQAGMVKILEEHASEYGAGTFENTPYPELEKFAELIVKECAGKVDFILREKSNGGGTMGDEIREHFGVEE